MPVAKLSLSEVITRLSSLGKAVVSVHGAGGAQARLVGSLSFEESPGQLLIKVGCGCQVEVQRDRLRHAVIGEKDVGNGNGAEGHVQLFDGNYDKVVAFSFPEGASAVRSLAESLDTNDFEIG
jgi:hypothetical protein